MKAKLLFIAFFVSFQNFAQVIPFELLPSGHIVAKAEIEGKTGTFIFDTGGGINLFFNDFAKDLSQRETYNFMTAFRATGERIDAPLYKSKEVKFGGKAFKNTAFTTFDMKLEGIDGLISLAMFSDTDFIIDYEKKQIVLGDIKKTDQKKAFDIQLGTMADNATDIFTYVELDGKVRIKVLLDSGAGSNSFWFSDKLTDVLGLDKKDLKLVERKSEFNENVVTKYYMGKIQSVSNGYAKVEKPNVTFVEGLIYEGKTSINWFGKKIGISLKNRKMYVLD